MTSPTHSFPRSKVRGRPDGVTLSLSIPKEIVHAMRIVPGESLEWIWVTEGLDSYLRLRKAGQKA